MPRPTIAMLSSPFLGARPWRGLADAANRAGWRATVIAQPTPPRSAADAARVYRDLLPAGDIVLLAHSNAGLYVPGLVADHPGVRAIVLLDAVLVPRGMTWAAVAPPELVVHLEPKVDEADLLPMWTDWWALDQVDELLPTSTMRAEVFVGQPQVPLSYLRDRVPVPEQWDVVPACYIAFGDTYAAERDDAAARGWGAVRLNGAGHLHMVVDPDSVMAHVDAFLTSL